MTLRILHLQCCVCLLIDDVECCSSCLQEEGILEGRDPLSSACSLVSAQYLS